jgi:hypothetical protein
LRTVSVRVDTLFPALAAVSRRATGYSFSVQALPPREESPLVSTMSRVRRAAVTAERAVLRAPWVSLAVWLIAWTAVEIVLSHTHMYSWHYVMTGARVLRSANWFELYGHHPELQMGPLTFLVAEPFALLPTELGRVVAAAAMAGLGLLIVREIRLIVPPASREDEVRWFALSAVTLVGWLEVAVRFGHLDDAMALLCALVAVRCARSGRLLLAALLLGLAIDFKPWAVPFAAALLIPAGRRRLLTAILVLVVVVGVVWLPFSALDPGASGALRFTIRVDPASTLHLLGVAGSSTPAWCRPAQFALGAILALVAVRRGRWPALLLIVVAVRLLLDPATQPYYDSGLLIGAVVFDLATASTSRPRRSGAATAIVVLLVYLPSYLITGMPDARGVLRTAGLVALLALAVVLRPRPRHLPQRIRATTA